MSCTRARTLASTTDILVWWRKKNAEREKKREREKKEKDDHDNDNDVWSMYVCRENQSCSAISSSVIIWVRLERQRQW